MKCLLTSNIVTLRLLCRPAVAQGDPHGWWALSPDAELVRVGRVRLGGWNANLGEARARIEIPKIGTGRWSFMFCDAGCREPMGSVIPTSVRVAVDALTAQTAARVAALERRTRGAMSDLWADLRDARLAAADAAAGVERARRLLECVMSSVRAL